MASPRPTVVKMNKAPTHDCVAIVPPKASRAIMIAPAFAINASRTMIYPLIRCTSLHFWRMTGVNWRTTSRLAAERSVSDYCKMDSIVAVLTQNGIKMKPDPNLVAVEVLVVVTFTWRSGVSSVRRSAEDA